LTDAPPSLALCNAEMQGLLVDVRIVDGRIDAIVEREPGARPMPADETIDVDGGALLPGLHDHHMHLLATAAAAASIDIRGRDLDQTLAAAHATRPPVEWLRLIGYNDAAAGAMDRDRLDALAPGRPVRLQHRSGALWVLSSAALDHLQAHDGGPWPDGVELDRAGRPTGRFFRLDEWLARRIPRGAPPDLAPVGRRLAALGITGVTDATPTTDPADFLLLERAVVSGDLRLGVTVMGGPALAAAASPTLLGRGPVKVVIADHALATIDDLVRWFAAAHAVDRAVAVHCVSDVALVLALAAWDEVGARPGDRIEHGSIIHPAHLPRLAAHGLTVVTQPGFLRQSGDRYLRDVDASDQPHLYRCSSLQAASIPVGGSTDAPFGPDDPWLAMAAAVDRTSAGGMVVGADEAVTPEVALRLFLSPATNPGGPARSVTVGSPADLCVLPVGVATALDDLAHVTVRATISAGAVAHLDR